MIDKSEDDYAELAREIVNSTSDDVAEFLKPLSDKDKKSRSRDPNDRLREYRIIVERTVGWTFCQSYSELMKSFLNEEIRGEEFESQFLRLRSQGIVRTKELCEKIEEGIESIPNFYYPSKSVDFKSVLDNFYFDLDPYNPKLDESESNDYEYSEEKLRAIVKEKVFPVVQESCEIDN